jgi:hypothetical protein
MSGGGFLQQSIGALNDNLGARRSSGWLYRLYGCGVGDKTAQTEAHRGLGNTPVESRGCIGSSAALPSGGTIQEVP